MSDEIVDFLRRIGASSPVHARGEVRQRLSLNRKEGGNM
jgi:hypothetical protein